MNIEIKIIGFSVNNIPEEKVVVCRTRIMTSVNQLFCNQDSVRISLLKVNSNDHRTSNKKFEVVISKYPQENVTNEKIEALRSDVLHAMQKLFDDNSIERNQIIISHKEDEKHHFKNVSKQADGNSDEEFNYKKRAETFLPQEPFYTFDRLVLPNDLLNKIEESLAILEYESKVFDEWGLRAIIPNPSSALNFYGPSGTGKTMAAEAVASKLGKKILRTSYADIESKYHGEGPKMVKAIFLAAEKNDAVLFIDEADSMLSKRLTNVTQGSEQAINSMRSQLLICLEQYQGIVVFATNLIENYDPAFLTRLILIPFEKPDSESREKIWKVHLYPNDNDGSSIKLNIPLSDEVNIKELSANYEFCGREIRNSVKVACVSAAMKHKNFVSQEDFICACEKIKKELDDLNKSKVLSEKNHELIKDAIKEKIKNQKI